MKLARAEGGDHIEAALWRAWSDDKSSAMRTRIVEFYLPWTRGVAHAVFMRVRGRSSDWPDYMQNASMGLLDAVASFDPKRGVPFQGYARQRVRGAVFNGLRNLFSISPSHDPHETLAERIGSMLEQDDNDDPVERFIAAVSGIALGHLLQKGGLPEPPITPKTPYDEALRSQLTLRISTLVRLLPEREQLLVRLHYLQHLPFGHIAGVLGVTKGRVSQLHAQALARMRSRLTHPSHAGAYDR